MVRVYEQVDQAAIDGSIAACSGLGAATAEYNREVEESGALGSGTNVITTSDAGGERAIHFESEANEPNATTWPAGFYTTRINVTTGNSNLDWETVHVCRVNSGGMSQATITSDSSLGISLTAGVKFASLSPLFASGAAATDRFYIVGGIIRSGGHGDQSATITNDQLLDTPFDAVVASGGGTGGKGLAMLLSRIRS